MPGALVESAATGSKAKAAAPSGRPPRRDLYIGGKWLGAEVYAPNINPSNVNDVEGEYASASERDVRDAIAAAREASAAWKHSSPQQRADLLDTVGTEIMSQSAEIADLLAREEGKTLPEALGEVVRAAKIFKFFAGEALRMHGECIASVRPGVRVEVTREAVGVVAVITPWNFPIAIPAWKIAPALAFGNCVVFKPAELTPGCAWRLTQILDRAGVPPGVFNLVMGSGSRIGAALTSDPRIDAVSFTGSETVGARVRQAAEQHWAKVQLELGGKNPLIVLDDANLDVAIQCAIQGGFYSAGQRCTASSRIIVTAGIHDAFLDALVRNTSQLVIGDARAAGTQIGPLVDARQLASVREYLEIGRREGASLWMADESRSGSREGFYCPPAIFTQADPRMRIAREEIFGPVVTLLKVRDYDEALSVANDSDYGLSAGICTRSLAAAEHFKRYSEAGVVMVNLPTAGIDYHVPFGGRKRSSFGPREQGAYAREFYTTVKTAYVSATG